MKDSHYRVSLDIHSTQSQVSLPVKQGDTSRKVFISLCEGGKPYHIEEDCFAVFSAKKPDKNIVENNCVIADNVIEFSVTEQVSAASGKIDCEVKLYGGDSGLITSPRFTIIVDARAVIDAEIESTSEYSALTELYTETITLNGDMVDFKTEMEEKVASGYFNGKDADYNLVSNALKGTARGELVTLTDMSPLEHTMKVKVSNPSATLTKHGKNLIPYPYYYNANTITSNGVTFTDNGQGIITANGTATARIIFYFNDAQAKIQLKKGEQYILSGCPYEGSASTYVIQATDSTSYHTDSGQGKTFVASGCGYYFYIVVYEGATLNNVVFTPQLELGTAATDYEPYKEPATYPINADGTVDGVTSLYPTTVLTTDTEGVTIDVEYNRDANKVIAELLELIIGKTFVADVKLYASKWVGTASPYSQVVTVEGATSRSQVDLTPSADQLAAFHSKDLAFVTENDNGKITVYAIGQRPTNDYTIQATVTEVKA